MSDTLYGTDRARWLALWVLSAAQLLVFLDATVVNVALPSIERGLDFSRTSLAWVVNAYLLTFGGSLLLAGRAGDVFGRRRIFLAGLAMFTLASLGCALANSQVALVAARAIQGMAAAVVSALGLAMIVTLFDRPAHRARAMGIFSFVASGGGTLGVLVGGVLTQVAGWQAIFLINVPLGIVLLMLVRSLEPESERLAQVRARQLDLPGAIAGSGSVVFLTLVAVSAGQRGWLAPRTLALLAGAAGSAGVLVVIERRSAYPLVPPRLLRSVALLGSNLLAGAMRAALVGWFFFGALHMRETLGFSEIQTGLGFLPATVVIGLFSFSLTPKLVRRFGVRRVFAAGTLLSAGGLGILALGSSGESFLVDVLPGMLSLGAGGGLLFMPLVLTATSCVDPADAGLASGLLTTSQQLGGALGLAVLAALAGSGSGGFRIAFESAAALAALASAFGLIVLPDQPPAS